MKRPGNDCPKLRLARAMNGARNAGRTERLAVVLQLGGTFDRSRRSWSITFSSLGLPVRSRAVQPHLRITPGNRKSSARRLLIV